MASPAKRRKIDKDSKSSSASSRNLDYFFSRQKKDLLSLAANGNEQGDSLADDPPELTDEQLAKRLQTEWDQKAVSPKAIPSSSAIDVLAQAQTGSGEVRYPNVGGKEQQNEDIHRTEVFLSADKKEEWKVDNKTSSAPHTKSKTTLSLQSAVSAEDTISSTIPFDESLLTFDPNKYIPDLRKHWATEGHDASYSLLTRCFVLVNNTQSRIKIVDTLVNLLRTVIEGDPSSLLPAVGIQREAIPHYLYQCFYINSYGLEAFEYFKFKALLTFKCIPILIVYNIRYGLPPTPYHLPTYLSSLAWVAQPSQRP